MDLPGATERLSIWKADLAEEGSFHDAIRGCTGVFHVATPMDFLSKDPEVDQSLALAAQLISLSISTSSLHMHCTHILHTYGFHCRMR
jgi:hypothetical protein